MINMIADKYEKETLTKLIPPSCLGIKCVYRTRVVSSTLLALQLLASTELTVPRLRSIDKIDTNIGKIVPLMLRRAIIQSLEYIPTGEVSRVVQSVLSPLPKKIREYVVTRFEEVAKSPLLYIESKKNILKSKVETGWKIVGNPLESMDTFIIPRKYLWYSVEYLTSVEANFKAELVFCDENECYPLPFGLFPTRTLTGLAYETGHIEKVDKLEQMYGGSNLAVIVTKLLDEIKESAVAIHPKKRKSTAVFFMRVDNPRELSLKLANMQVSALEIEDELLKKVLGEEYKEFNTDNDINRIIEEQLEEEFEE